MNPLSGLVSLSTRMRRPCSECPWRFSNHATPERFGGDAGAWTNRTLLEGGGRDAPCHTSCRDVSSDAPLQRRPGSASCAGITGIYQRALIRHLLDDGWLPESARETLFKRFVKHPVDDREAAARELIANAHPAVFDPAIGCRLVPAPTEEEIARWTAIRAKA